MALAIFLIIFYFCPMAVCGWLCRERNRNVNKGLVVGFLTGWLGALGLWLGLKTRNPETMQLY